jgi:hypothetical protein
VALLTWPLILQGAFQSLHPAERSAAQQFDASCPLAGQHIVTEQLHTTPHHTTPHHTTPRSGAIYELRVEDASTKAEPSLARRTALLQRQVAKRAAELRLMSLGGTFQPPPGVYFVCGAQVGSVWGGEGRAVSARFMILGVGLDCCTACTTAHCQYNTPMHCAYASTCCIHRNSIASIVF